jgi:adenylate cyclase
MPSSSDRDPRFTLFVTILTLFLSAALLVGVAVTAADYIQNHRNALKVASETFKEKIGRINERRLAFFAAPFAMVQQLRDDRVLRDPSGSSDPIPRTILSSLTMNPQISAVYAGYENGSFLHILSISDSEKSFIEGLGGPAATRFAIREIRAGSGGRTESWRFLDAAAQQIGMLGDEVATFDPRRRDWYRDARAHPEKVVRNAPYVFAATGQMGMTLAAAIEGGAIGVDITLDRLMAYVRSVRSNETQRFVAFDERNRLLAHFDPEQMFKVTIENESRVVELITTADLRDPVIHQAAQIFARKGPYELERFRVDGSDYLATVANQVGRDGSPFYVLYAAPLSDFLGPLAHAAARSILTALAIFALALPAIIYFAHSISRPLRKLA